VRPKKKVEIPPRSQEAEFQLQGRCEARSALYVFTYLKDSGINILLAIVHALGWLEARALTWPVYSDSRVARGWVEKGRCNSRLPRTPETNAVWALVARAEAWLAEHPDHAPVLRWDTRLWGEIPADFNRK